MHDIVHVPRDFASNTDKQSHFFPTRHLALLIYPPWHLVDLKKGLEELSVRV